MMDDNEARRKLIIHLDDQYARQWHRRGGLAVTGRVFVGNTLFEGESFLDIAESALRENRLESTLKTWNGNFALVAQMPEQTVAAVDWMRSTPLFWASRNGTIYISDNATWVADSSELETINDLAQREFHTAGFVSGNETLLEGLNQLQAGEMVVFDTEAPFGRVHCYDTDCFPDDRRDESMSQDEAFKRLEEAFDDLGRRMVQVLDGRQAIVPLSGGYDSRCILWMLRQQGYDNIFTFTYGRKDNREARVAREITKKLSVPWQFVEYTPETWQGLLEDEEYRRFCHFSGNLSTLPHPSDFSALRHLRRDNRLSPEAMVLPGHTALAPSQVLQRWDSPMSWGNLHKRIYELCYCNSWKLTLQEGKDLCCQRVTFSKPADLSPTRCFELWHWRNAETKYIFNSQRSLEYWGLDWFLPLADRALMDIYWTFPAQWYYQKKVFNKYMAHVCNQLDLPPRCGSTTSWQKKLIKQMAASLGMYKYLRRKINQKKRHQHAIGYFWLVPESRWSQFESMPDSAWSFSIDWSESVLLDRVSKITKENAGEAPQC
ncbi:MAG: 7-cyano-7-deazaguanine synthase [Sedimentisphaerales bacterium]|nr:7-cyano-7-deazaguanine synthase [Sedimentisphaerales bacterium]